MKSILLKYVLPFMGIFVSVFMLVFSYVSADTLSLRIVCTYVGDNENAYGRKEFYTYSVTNSDPICCYMYVSNSGTYNWTFYSNVYNSSATYVYDFATSYSSSTTDHRTGAFTFTSSTSTDFGTIYGTSYNLFNGWSASDVSLSVNGYTDFKVFDSLNECANYLYNGVTDGDITVDDTVYDDTSIEAPSGYWNFSTSTSGGFYHPVSITLNNYDTSYGLVLKARYTTPSIMRVNFRNVLVGDVLILEQATSDIEWINSSSDPIAFASSGENTFSIYEYVQDNFVSTCGSSIDAATINFYQSDGTSVSNSIGESNIKGSSSAVVAAGSAQILYDARCPYNGLEIWAAYCSIDDYGSVTYSEWTKFTSQAITSGAYDRYTTALTWDNSDVSTTVSVSSQTNDSVGDTNIYDSADSSNIQSATGSTSLGSASDLDYGSSVNSLKNGITSLYSLCLSVPQFLSSVLGYLPNWVITLMAVSIGLIFVIGVIKSLT